MGSCSMPVRERIDGTEKLSEVDEGMVTVNNDNLGECVWVGEKEEQRLTEARPETD